MITFIDLICPVCLKPFKKIKKSYNQNVKRNKLSYCSRSCAVSGNNFYFPRGNPNIKSYASNKKDEFSSFRYFVCRINDRKRTCGESDIDLNFLKSLWLSQNGICPYTGLVMELPRNTTGFASSSPFNASLDRIDSEKGYMRDNVQFVCVFINLGKNGFTHEQTRNFLEQFKNVPVAKLPKPLASNEKITGGSPVGDTI